MPLIELKTDLKSLKYGKDTLGGGYSGQPYIQTPIPDSFNDLGAREDFILRGNGNVVADSLTDIARLTKMFTDTKSPNGLLFIAKQQLLSRTAVRTQTSRGGLNEGVYSPLNTLAQAGVSAFGLHLNKQGDPFELTGAYAFDNPNLYQNKVKSTQDPNLNRLVQLNKLISINSSNKLDDFILNNGPINVLTYTGGPGAPLGIGNTNIRFADQRTGDNNAIKISNPNYFYGKGQFSVNGDNIQVGGLKVEVGLGDKPWIRGGIYFNGGAKTIYDLSTLFPEYSNGLPSNNVNSPQTGSLTQIPDGKKTWTPNQSISRSFNDLINVETLKGVSKEYEKTNIRLDSDFNSGDKVYDNNSEVGVNGKLFNPLASGPVTWTPNQSNPDSSKYLKTFSHPSSNTKGPINNEGVSGKYFSLVGGIFVENELYNIEGQLGKGYNYFNVYNPNTTPGNTWPDNTDLIYSNNTFTYNQKDIISTENNVGKLNGSPKIQDFRAILRSKLQNKYQEIAFNTGATSKSLDYTTKNIEQRVNLGDPGQRANNYGNYQVGVRDPTTDESLYKLKEIGNKVKLGSYKPGLDKITSLPIYRSENVTDDNVKNDLVKFRIAIIDNNSPNFKTFIHFRAFLNSMSDSYNSTWNSFQYLGRGENFYTYNGFTRTISLSWTVAAQSKQELIPMYKKLNYLASSLTPDYSPAGYMRGVLCQLTVGGYLYEQPGFISSITYDVPQESPWEIGIGVENSSGDSTVKELPHIINVTGFSFTPIQNFIPRLQDLAYNNKSLTNPLDENDIGFVSEYGKERYISLSNGSGSNYDSN